VAVAVVVGLSAACVDAPVTAPNTVDDNQLATGFEDLSQERNAAGDVERGEEFRWAALAIRLGVTPTLFEVTNDGQVEAYQAFVHAVKWSLPVMATRPLTHRTFVAWRKTPEKMQVILISSHLDLAPVLHPYSMRVAPGTVPTASPIAGAHAAYFERSATSRTWIGVNGQVKLAEESVAGPCNLPESDRTPGGVTCQLARWAVRFNIGFMRARNEGSEPDLAAALKTIVAAEQQVAGVKLTFTCPVPTSERGCR
jgi:hypothetical protein